MADYAYRRPADIRVTLPNPALLFLGGEISGAAQAQATASADLTTAYNVGGGRGILKDWVYRRPHDFRVPGISLAPFQTLSGGDLAGAAKAQATATGDLTVASVLPTTLLPRPAVYLRERDYTAVLQQGYSALWVDQDTAGAALAGSAQARASSTGVLATDIQLAGAAAALASATGDLTSGLAVRSVTLTLVDLGDGSLVNLTGLKWAFFDQVTPDLFSAPVDKGSIETTDGSGVIVILLPNTTLPFGGVGWLDVTDSDGTPGQHGSFSGPVTVG